MHIANKPNQFILSSRLGSIFGRKKGCFLVQCTLPLHTQVEYLCNCVYSVCIYQIMCLCALVHCRSTSHLNNELKCQLLKWFVIFISSPLWPFVCIDLSKHSNTSPKNEKKFMIVYSFYSLNFSSYWKKRRSI